MKNIKEGDAFEVVRITQTSAFITLYKVGDSGVVARAWSDGSKAVMVGTHRRGESSTPGWFVPKGHCVKTGRLIVKRVKNGT